MRCLVTAAVGLSIVLAACDLVGAPPGGPAGRTFVSTAVTRDGAAHPLVPGTGVRLAFGEDGRLGADAGCNQIGGSWRLDGDRLRLEDVATTDMGCDEARHAQDEWLVSFLTSGPRLLSTGDEVVLEADGMAIRLLDREVADPDRPLVGTRWTLDATRVGDAVSSVPAGVVATVRLTDAGQIEVHAGCNRGSGHYTLDGDRIRVEQLVTTRMACGRDEAAVETAVLGVLESEPAWMIEAGGLRLESNAGGLSFRAP